MLSFRCQVVVESVWMRQRLLSLPLPAAYSEHKLAVSERHHVGCARVSPQTGTQKITYATNPVDLLADLAHQAFDATNGHAQGANPLTAEQQKQIVDFEMALITAQAYRLRGRCA